MSVQSLEVRLGDVLVGHLTHNPDEKTRVQLITA